MDRARLAKHRFSIGHSGTRELTEDEELRATYQLSSHEGKFGFSQDIKLEEGSVWYVEPFFDPNPSKSVKTELADDGRPAPAALPGDCCGLPSPTRSPDGSKRPKFDHFEWYFVL